MWSVVMNSCLVLLAKILSWCQAWKVVLHHAVEPVQKVICGIHDRHRGGPRGGSKGSMEPLF